LLRGRCGGGHRVGNKETHDLPRKIIILMINRRIMP
jgi:hypothetical protein